MSSKDVYLVIGGSGFVGGHIVRQLLERGDTVAVLDITQRHHNVPFYSGDITQQEQVSDALRKSGATCVIHTASPPACLDDEAIYWKVNVEGTKAVIAAAQENGVRKLVFTSSAGVVFNGRDLVGVDERLPPPEQPFDAYNASKAKAEQVVLSANGQQGLLTVALRPAGIFGEGDRQLMTGLYAVYENNQTHFQIGDNTNLFDWTYVGNVAHAHLLAADKLVTPPCDEKGTPHAPDPHPFQQQVILSNFDQHDPYSNVRQKIFPLHIAGQAFFITNGEPMYFWDLPRIVWTRLDAELPNKLVPKKRIVLPKSIGLFAASGAEWWSWLIGKEPTFTRYKVTYSCATRWYNVEKARRVLGYEPKIGMEEGIRRTINWWLREHGYTAQTA